MPELEYCPVCDSLVTKSKCINEGCLYGKLKDEPKFVDIELQHVEIQNRVKELFKLCRKNIEKSYEDYLIFGINPTSISLDEKEK